MRGKNEELKEVYLIFRGMRCHGILSLSGCFSSRILRALDTERAPITLNFKSSNDDTKL